MPYIPKDQIVAAREMDLLTYLRRFEPQELVHIGGNTYTTRTHDSLKISNGKWCWWSRNIGGTNALDYLTCVEGIPFLDAVQRILGEPPHAPTKSEPPAPLPKTEFTLPPKHADNRRVFAYLRSRGIDAEIINHCIKHGQLYEDAVHHKHYAEWKAEQGGKPTVRGIIRADIDTIIGRAYTYDSFLMLLRKNGYEVRRSPNRKYTTVKPPGAKRAIRLDSLGEGYTEADILLRLSRQRHGGMAPPTVTHSVKRYRVKGRLATVRKKKITGFHALYLRYLYLLRGGRRKKLSPRLPFSVKREVIHLERYEQQLSPKPLTAMSKTRTTRIFG